MNAKVNIPFDEICGAIHIHTRFSDGEVDFRELIEAATEVDLDYVVVTDHMTLEGKERHYEGVYRKLLVLVGYEHNDSNDQNHYLAIGTSEVVAEQESVQGYINAIRNAGGTGFLAHPAEERRYFKQYPPYPWTAWDVTGFDGIELWNHMSEWVESLKNWRSFIRIFYPRRFLKGIPQSLLKRWDSLNMSRFVSGIGGVDAHTFHLKKGIFRVQIFPIKVELKGIRTHLYVPDTYTDSTFVNKKELFMDAVKNGTGFISNFRRGDARGTVMHARFADGTVVLPGWAGKKPIFPAVLSVHLPLKSEIRLIRNGQVQEKYTGNSHQFTLTEKGLYRVEVFRGRKVWIYSNPFPLGTYPL